MTCVLAILISGLTDIWGVGTWKLAGELEKANHRYGIYDAAKLIGWLAFDAVHPGDADAVKAIEGLKSSIAKVKTV